jgi:hypothetical protein
MNEYTPTIIRILMEQATRSHGIAQACGYASFLDWKGFRIEMPYSRQDPAGSKRATLHLLILYYGRVSYVMCNTFELINSVQKGN